MITRLRLSARDTAPNNEGSLYTAVTGETVLLWQRTRIDVLMQRVK